MMDKIEKKEYAKNYREIHKDRINKLTKKWYETHKKYYQRWRETHKKYFKEYRKNHKEQKKICYAKWKKTEKGISYKRKDKQRRRGKKYIQILPNIFPKDIPIDFHHIDGKMFVVPIPSSIHEKINGNDMEKHLVDVNDWIEFYYNLNPTNFLRGEF